MPIGIAPARADSFGLPDLGYVKGIAEGANGTFQTIAALAGGAQATATQIASNVLMVNVATVASANDSVRLNFAVAGRYLMAYNSSANSANVFAQSLTNKVTNSLDTINGGTNSTAVALGAKKSILFFCPKDGIWVALIGP